MLFLLASYGFRQNGLTEMARAYVVPTLVAGLLLLAVGTGILIANRARVTGFAEAYQKDPVEFVQVETSRTAQVLGEYRRIVFVVIPLIVVAAALVIVFIDKAAWRASAITVIALMVVILLVDSNANARIEAYREALGVGER